MLLIKGDYRLIAMKPEVREQEAEVGDLPLMTETGTFIINGAEV
jgi:DNA-directed RNA polymerase beta subunit